MRTKNIFLTALAAFSLASCSKDGTEGPDAGDQDGDIRFEIGFEAQTRASTAADFTSAWESGDEIGLFAVAHGSAPATSGNFIHNVKLTYDGTSWTHATPLYWPADGRRLDFYAYYPYDAAASDPTAIAFNVMTNQSALTGGRSNYDLSDLLTAKADNAGAGYDMGSIVSLTFKHALAMVQVSVPLPRVGFGPGPDLAVTLRGVRARATLDLGGASGPEAALAATANDPVNIKMWRVEQPADANYMTSYTYRALVPVQTMASGSVLFAFEHEQRQLFLDAPLSAALPMSAGRAETFERTIPTVLHTALIPAGTFIMGSSDGTGDNGMNPPPAELNRNINEVQHRVTLTRDFYMSKYEITNAQYAAFLNAKGIGSNGKGSVTYDLNGSSMTSTEKLIYDCTKAYLGIYRWGLKWNTVCWEPVPGYENHPAIYVSWYGAKAYADWVGGALPTEAQWEYACRAGTTTAYSYGNVANGDYKWYVWNNSPDGTKAVGGKLPNPWGLYDMHGNVNEWCSDQWDLTSNYLFLPSTDPVGTVGIYRVMRGGDYNDGSAFCRSALRKNYSSDSMYEVTGFRIVFVQ